MLRHDCIDTISMPVANSGTTNSWKSWITAGRNLLVTDMAHIVEIIVEWQRRYTRRIHLNELNDSLLKDIGISREEAFKEIRKPFWQA
jgi:uncharacterized protein YjiS (DUF1127 family)